MSATRCRQPTLPLTLSIAPPLPSQMGEWEVLDHRIRSSSSLAAGMRETAKFNPSDVPVFRSLGHWTEKGRPTKSSVSFVLSEQRHQRTQYQQQFQGKNKG